MTGKIIVYFVKRTLRNFPDTFLLGILLKLRCKDAQQNLLNRKKGGKRCVNLKNSGTFLRNRLSMTVRPVKRVQKSSNYGRNDYLPCSYCMGFYSRRSLYMHTKKCLENPKAGTALQHRQTSQSDGQTTIIMGYYKKDRLLKNLPFPRLRANPIP